MKKIVLLCANGMSTSLLVDNMRKVVEKEGYNYKISAHAISTFVESAADVDAILIGPQVRYELKKVSDKLPEKAIEVIDMSAYGMVDGKKVVEQARKMMGD